MHENIRDMTLEQILQNMDLSEDEKAYVYMTILEAVAKRMDHIVAKALSVEDMEHVESLSSEEEAHEYMAKRFEEVTGRTAQDVSDELMRLLIEKMKEEGVKAVINKGETN